MVVGGVTLFDVVETIKPSRTAGRLPRDGKSQVSKGKRMVSLAGSEEKLLCACSSNILRGALNLWTQYLCILAHNRSAHNTAEVLGNKMPLLGEHSGAHENFQDSTFFYHLGPFFSN